LQQLEVRRLNDMLASLRGAVATAPRTSLSRPDETANKISAFEKSLADLESGIQRIDSRLASMEKADKPASAEASNTKRPVAVLSDAQAKDMKAAVAELTTLKKEIATLRDLIERRTSEMQSGVPTFRKPAGGG